MAKKRRQLAVQHGTAVGPMLPTDVLERVANEDAKLPGLRPSDYGLAETERLGEAITRSWTRLTDIHRAFTDDLAASPLLDTAAGPTFKQWLRFLFQELGYGTLTATPTARTLDDATGSSSQSFPISHQWNHVPIHLVGVNVPLDRRTSGVTGASRSAPHSLIQEWLNRSEGSLWGIVSNGRQLRLVRDNVSMTRQAFVEFDLEAMFKGQSFADFRLLWLTLHATRFDIPADGQPHECVIEKWHVEGATVGTRVLGELSTGVKQAIEALGRGFLAHPANDDLRTALASGELAGQEYYRQLLRLVYRLLFLFVTESRDLLLDPAAPRRARDLYKQNYSATRLQTLAGTTRGNRHRDLYESLKLVMKALGGAGAAPLGLLGLGGYLWSDAALGLLGTAALSNAAILAAVRSLSYIIDKDGRRPVDYKNLGSEELGGVYEQLLELHPEINPTAPLAADRFTLGISAGNERKTSGSHYTPDSLVQVCLDTALEPLLAERLAGKRGPDAETALLALKICDTAVGSGHFLIGAAHRLAKRLAAVRTGDTEPSPEAYRTALRDCIRNCLYGVDLNPMAAELCRVNLWLESMEPGKPLSFLDHHIKIGNSLLGATPALLAAGIPDAAFEPIEGDDKKLCSRFKKANKKEREDAKNRQQSLFAAPLKLGNLTSVYAALSALPDDSLDQVAAKARQYESLVSSSDYKSGRLLADAWCAAFVWKKTPEFDFPVTEEVFRAIESNPHSLAPWMLEEIQRLAKQYKFFHWHLEFPDVFGAAAPEATNPNGWTGGFDCILGNPVWETLQMNEQEFFAERAPEIATAPNAAARKKLIASLPVIRPELSQEWAEAFRESEGARQLIRESGRFSLTAVGKINTFAVFSELNRTVLNPSGRAAFIVPAGIATDDTTKAFFADLVKTDTLRALYHFENTRGLFPNVHSSFRYVVLGVGAGSATDFFFFAHSTKELTERHRHFRLEPEDFALLNPNTRTCPTFRSVADAELNKYIYRRTGVLWDETKSDGNSWELSFSQGLFNMASDSDLFRTRAEMDTAGQMPTGNSWHGPLGGFLPLIEAKMVSFFDSRYSTFEGATQANLNSGNLPLVTTTQHQDPNFTTTPDYWISEDEVHNRLAPHGSPKWLMGWRDACRSTDWRTVIAAITPAVAVGHKLPLLFMPAASEDRAGLYGCLSSFVLDYCARQKVGGASVSYFLIKQFPIAAPQFFHSDVAWDNSVSLSQWLLPRIVELTYTAWDLEPFAADCGYAGPPFVWDEERRFLLRAEVDAAFFHLYLGTPDAWSSNASDALKTALPTPRDAVSQIMETFPIVKKKDLESFGTFRTKDTILDIYDSMATAIRTGQPYETHLSPPPADQHCRHEAPAPPRSH
ncbi:MAG: Eco57I restriction-modification methylase domain-containing protein [Planctomycetia bacterium]